MLLRAIVLACAAAAAAAAPPGRRAATGAWNYDRCDSANGPASWPGSSAESHCDAAEQSPINLCGAAELPQAPNLQLAAGYAAAQTYQLSTDGQAYLDAAGLDLTLNAGNLAKLNRPSLPDQSATWKLAQAHFHWGRSNEEGSEHYVEGEQYPLELHFVHVNTAYNDGDIDAALASGKPDALLVVGQMFKVGASQSATMDKIAAGIRGGEVATARSIVTSDLMDTSDGYYTYAGSLTTPPCNPVVTWVVLASAIDVTEATLEAFRKISKDGQAVSDKGNYRNLQTLGSRQIYSSAGVMSRRCGSAGPREPHFECATSSSAGSASSNTEGDTFMTSKMQQEPLKGADTMDFGGQTFIVAVHEEHPFIFFDCDHILATCAFAAEQGNSVPCGAKVMKSEPTYCTAAASASPDALRRAGSSGISENADSENTGGHDCSHAAEIPVGLSSATPSSELPEWACGRLEDGQGIGKFRKGKTNGGCEVNDKYYPFCGITIDVMDRVCQKLNCKLEFYIAHADPHYWESQEKALCAVGAWQQPGSAHWADIAAGAIHIDTANAQGVHFSTPYYQTGYRLVVPKRTDDGNWFHFKDVFDDWMWVIGIFVECLFVGVLLFLMESPEMSYNQGKIWKGKTSSQDTDVVPGTIAGLLDCWYWALSTYTTYVDKAPRTPGGKLVMMGHGFYMLIMISSYTANLASVLSQKDVSLDFTGWREGRLPVIDRMEDVSLAIPSGMSQTAFIHHEEVAERTKFKRVNCYESWEESMDAVLCGEVPAAFHDEAMVLYYLNHEMIKFGAGKYVPRVGNCDTKNNPHEQKSWGKGRNYQWGEADSDNKGGKACALTWTGEIFHTAGYGLAFGRDSTAFVPWSRIISELKEAHVIANMMDSSNERDFGIGQSGAQKFMTRCGESSISDQFILNDFIGLYIILASFLWAGFLAQFTEYRFFHKPIDPFDSDFGQSKKVMAQDQEASMSGKGARSVEDIEKKLEEMREKQEHSKETIQRILQVVRQREAEWGGGGGKEGSRPAYKMIEAGPPEVKMIEAEPQMEPWPEMPHALPKQVPREVLMIEPAGDDARPASNGIENFAFA